MKRLFFVLRTRGAGWDREKTLEEQDAWPAHRHFMDRLTQEGFITLGGPLEGTPNTLLLVMAQSEDDVRTRLAEDVWAANDTLRVERVAPWTVKWRS